jgi:hypothetical protein
MSYYNKVKKALEKCSKSKDIKITKKDNRLIIKKENTILVNYDLKFIDFSKQNANNFIDYWANKLKSI